MKTEEKNHLVEIMLLNACRLLVVNEVIGRAKTRPKHKGFEVFIDALLLLKRESEEFIKSHDPGDKEVKNALCKILEEIIEGTIK